MAFLVATTSLPAVYSPNYDARTTTPGTPHARAKSRRGEGVSIPLKFQSKQSWQKRTEGLKRSYKCCNNTRYPVTNK